MATKSVKNKSKNASKSKKFHNNEALNDVLKILVKASSNETQSFSKKQKQSFINTIAQQINS
ncbi:hypothetical protein DAY19_14410 [Halobacteriovorax vibrionivorans]|uniref:Uncharacterized protein n=1 Tax=Halobacteriovorax vibrionivorans TaxID=2152716 RepID=A0ABY0IDX8_9BACT|nr:MULTISPECIES: hypothetical protein [Halobacteriovorax]RZF21167.1 hypothetical protein DAY19_14410 [Halobacteriovorax vibrionivorans]TGD46072.1 hypothetical protein EP118_13475 [Halobacteriovorax sp. Y22]